MTKKTLSVLALLLAAIVAVAQNRILIELTGQGGKGVIAIPDFRGSGDAAAFMGTFNTTLWAEIDQSGLFRMAPKNYISAPGAAATQGHSRGAGPRTCASAPQRDGSASAADRNVPFRLGRPSGQCELSCFRIHRGARRSSRADGLFL